MNGERVSVERRSGERRAGGPPRALAWLLQGCVAVAALLVAAHALAQAAATPAAQRPRNVEITENRIALVIGNAAYRFDPLDNPVNDARLIASTLKKAGFEVALHENLDRAGMVDALRQFGDRLNDRTIAVLYYAGHGVQLRDRNYLIPVDAEIRSEDEIPINGMDVSFFLNRMAHARSRINIVILDACRNNPFVGSGGPAARGLAQMDAPVGTLLAFATAPGKLTPDNIGPPGNSLYTAELAKHMLTPGLPVELMFKRVREAVVKGTDALQVPWESSSLQGEFAFVPGITTAREANAELEAAGELAFWNSIQSSQRADEYRAYLRQYPNGKFAALAQTRIAAFSPPPAPAPTTAPRPAGADAPSALPRAGDTWRYRIKDQFRLGDLFMTATVDEVTPAGVAETWTTTSDEKLRTTLAPLRPGFHSLPGWTLTPPEFAPYLYATGLLQTGQKIADQKRPMDKGTVALRVTVEGEEEVVVPAGRFRAIRVALRGPPHVRGASRTRTLSAEHVVWYAPEVKRMVKYAVSTRIGNSVQEDTVFELMEYRLH